MSDSLYRDEKARLYEELRNTDPESEVYDSIVKALKVLSEIEKQDAPPAPEAPPPPDRIRKDTLVTAGTTILMTCLVLFWEHGHPVASKAFGFIPKLLR